MKHNIGVVINYCTNDYRFIKHTIRQASTFTNHIIVSISDHFFDGTYENSRLLNKTIRENPRAEFVRFKYDSKKKVQNYPWWRLRRILKLSLQSGSQYWICYQRLVGYLKITDNIEYVLFLDADEIIDSRRFKEWLGTERYRKYTAMKFANYWYFREPRYQATVYEDTPLMVKKGVVKETFFFDYSEREGMYQKILGRKKRMIVGLDSKPMIHHYGWVRTKKEMLKKVSSWGHNRDCDWKKLVDEEFSHAFTGRDFIQKYRHRLVKSFINF